MAARVKVGDTVTLNNYGLEQVFGSRTGLAFMKRQEMKVTKVAGKSITEPEETYVVSVDNDAIDQFIIDDRCFDVVKS